MRVCYERLIDLKPFPYFPNRSTNSTKTIAQEILSSAAQKVGTTQNPTKEERIAQLQAAQALIQKQIAELLEAEG